MWIRKVFLWKSLCNMGCNRSRINNTAYFNYTAKRLLLLCPDLDWLVLAFCHHCWVRGCWTFNWMCQTDVCQMDMCECAEKNRWSQHETVFPAGKLALEKPKSNYGIWILTPETYWLRMNVISLNDSQSFLWPCRSMKASYFGLRQLTCSRSLFAVRNELISLYLLYHGTHLKTNPSGKFSLEIKNMANAWWSVRASLREPQTAPFLYQTE